jgi:putative ABC transport system substrate-binding protein
MAIHIGRRGFIATLGGAAAWPLAASAQEPKMPVIGYLNAGSSPDQFEDRLRAFRQGLSESGYVEGQNVMIEYRWTDQYGRLPAIAADLIHRQVTVIAAASAPAALAAKAATAQVPIVFLFGGDPIAARLVASLNRPGGNITGVTFLSAELAPKLLELLHELVPAPTTIAVLVNPTNPNTVIMTDVQRGARALGLQILVLRANSKTDFETAFASLVQQHAGALVVPAESLFFNYRHKLVALAAGHAIPTIYAFREIPEAGGLISYGASLASAYRQQGVYIGKILRGAQPADLPVQQAVKIELVINLKTAKALGLTIPITLLGRADEVIE